MSNPITLTATPSKSRKSGVQAELERLREENARLKAAKGNGKLSLKVSAKGAVSLYGLQRFPVTLYASQLERVLNASDEIRKFISANAAHLERK